MIERIILVHRKGAKLHEVRRPDGKQLKRLCLDLLEDAPQSTRHPGLPVRSC